MMKKKTLILGLLVLMAVCTSCRIPTLPPLDSTITIEISRKTDPPQASPTQVKEQSEPTEPAKDPTSEPTDIPPTHTPEPTSTQVPPTWTPEPTSTRVPPTQTPEPSPTPTKSPTLKPSSTPTSTPTNTPEPTKTPTPTPFPYGFQEGSPTYMSNFAHPEEGCGWLGIAGQIFDRKGEVVKDVVVKAGGTLNGEPILNSLSMPGAAKAYGPGGYELVLSDDPLDSEEEVWIQLFDLSSHPLSEKTYLTTYAACDKNLILLNFIEK